MVKDQENDTNSVRASRVAKAKLFMSDRAAFMAEMVASIHRAETTARNKGLKLCVRLNGATDIGWEGVRLPVQLAGNPQHTIFDLFPNLQFVDYTKNVKRALMHAAGMLPKNYHLTFSRSENDEADCVRVREAGGNVAVVSSRAMPETYLGHVVINGDAHDLRHLDNRTAARGACVIWLSPKGLKAKRDVSGFVVRL